MSLKITRKIKFKKADRIFLLIRQIKIRGLKMTNEQIAKRLIQLCEETKFTEARKELYFIEAKSIESDNSSIIGIEAMLEKGKKWSSEIEQIHSVKCSKPIFAARFFSTKFTWDILYKEKGRVQWEEIAVYEIQKGKIVLEKFFY